MLRIVDKRDQTNSLIIDHSDGSVQPQQNQGLAISARPRGAVQEVPNYDIRTIVRRPSLVKLNKPVASQESRWQVAESSRQVASEADTSRPIDEGPLLAKSGHW